MIISIKDIPNNIKPYKVLDWSKLPKFTTEIDGFPDKINLDKIKTTCFQLVKTLLTYGGIGLAAPQCGIAKKVFLIKKDDDTIKVYFHPTYEKTNDLTEVYEEGCLSVPGKWLIVERPHEIQAKWFELDEANKFVEQNQKMEGFEKMVFVHEFDHLMGIDIQVRNKQYLNKINQINKRVTIKDITK